MHAFGAPLFHKCSNKSIRALRKIGKFRKATIPERAPGARAPNSQRPIMASLWSSRARRRARPAALQFPRRNGAQHPRFDSHLLRDMISTSNFWFSQVVVHSQLHLRMCSGGPEGARSKSLRQSKMVRPTALPQWSTTFVVPVFSEIWVIDGDPSLTSSHASFTFTTKARSESTKGAPARAPRAAAAGLFRPEIYIFQ